MLLNQVEDKLGFAQPVTPGHPPPASGSASTSLAAPPLYSSASCLCLCSADLTRTFPPTDPHAFVSPARGILPSVCVFQILLIL